MQCSGWLVGWLVVPLQLALKKSSSPLLYSFDEGVGVMDFIFLV